MTKKLTTYDPAAALVNDEEIAFFMADAFETGDAAYIAKSLGIVARAKGMAQIAVDTGLSRAQLYRSFSEDGNPTLKTTMTVMKSLGIGLTARTPALAQSTSKSTDLSTKFAEFGFLEFPFKSRIH